MIKNLPLIGEGGFNLMFFNAIINRIYNYVNWWHFLNLKLIGVTNTLHLRLLGSPTIIPSSQLKTAMTWYYYKREDLIFICSFLFSNDNVIESNFLCSTMANKKVLSNIRKSLMWDFTLNQGSLHSMLGLYRYNLSILNYFFSPF